MTQSTPPDTNGPAPSIIVRPATAADLPRIGRLGALLVEAHYNLDAKRFLATKPRTPLDYAGGVREPWCQRWCQKLSFLTVAGHRSNRLTS